MSQITVDLVLLLKQAVPRLVSSSDTLLLQQWLERQAGLEQFMTIDLAATATGDEAGAPPLPASLALQERISDVITFGDDSELRLSILAPSGGGENLATDASYGLLTAISNI